MISSALRSVHQAPLELCLRALDPLFTHMSEWVLCGNVCEGWHPAPLAHIEALSAEGVHDDDGYLVDPCLGSRVPLPL